MRSEFVEVYLYIFLIMGLFVFGSLVAAGGIFLRVSDKKVSRDDKDLEKIPSAAITVAGAAVMLLSAVLFVAGVI